MIREVERIDNLVELTVSFKMMKLSEKDKAKRRLQNEVSKQLSSEDIIKAVRDKDH